MHFDKLLGGKVTCISFIENTHSIAAASDNGSIHIFRVHYISAGKYGKCEAVRKISLDNEFAVTMEHYHTGNASKPLNVSSMDLHRATTLLCYTVSKDPRSVDSHF